MAGFDTLLPRIVTRAVQVPEPAAIDAIREATIELCEKARAWPFQVDVTLTSAAADEIPVPPGAVLHEIETVRFDGRRLEPRTIYDLEDRFSAANTQGAPAYYAQLLEGSIIVKPPAPGEVIRVSGYLKPDIRAAEAPDYLLREHRELIADGALARLLLIPGQAWTSLELGTYHQARWQHQLDHILANFLQGQQRAPLRTRPQYF